MKIELSPGRYVVAVSGGVDSMVLLDIVSKQKNAELIVAHFDHGIHEYSNTYCEFVAIRAKDMGLKFVYEEGKLGPNASEAAARYARYEFLNKVKNKYKADAILTAHHQDDLVETILINVIRGTNTKGLSSLKSGNKIIRPLLGYSKIQVVDYAKNHNIEWKEDPTNKDQKYLRNYLRLKIIPKMSNETRKNLLKISEDSKQKNKEISNIIEELTANQEDGLDRKVFSGLDHASAREVLAGFLNRSKIPFDKKLLEQCVNFIKTAKLGKKFVLSTNRYFEIDNDKVMLNLL